MSESNLTELRKGKIKKILISVLIIIGIGSIITVLVILYINSGVDTGDNNTGG